MLKYLYQQRPVTAPAVMTMEEYKTHMTQKSHPPSQISKSSSLASVEDSNKVNETPVNKPDINVEEDASESSRPQAEEVKPSVKNIAEDLEEQTEATDKADDESSESCAGSDRVETPVSDKMKLMKLMEEDSPITDSARRVKSAIVPRIHRAQDRDNGFENGEDCQPRSQSAFGGSRVDQAIEDIAPMPYMEHSKPKFVSVGSIGKVSLLESITEAKYWEDLAMEQQHAKKQKQLKTIKGNDNVEDMGKQETELVPNNNINEEKNRDQPRDKELDARNEIFDREVLDDFEVMDGRSSSQSKKHRKKSKKSLVNDLDVNDGEDVLAMILAEEKRRRRLQKVSGKKHSFNFCSSARTSKSNSPSSTSRSRLGSSTSYTSKSSSENKKAEDEKEENKKTVDVENNDKPQYRSALKSPEKASKRGTEKHVIVRTVSELQEENKKAPSKYDRLIKRLGDDMTPYLKSQMLKVS